MDRNKRFLVILAVVFIIAILTIFLFPKNNVKQITQNTLPTPKAVDLCISFTKDPGEISCEEAKTITIKRFLGVIKRIRKTTELIPTEKSLKPKMAERKLWLILVHLDKPQESSVSPNGEKRLYPDIEVGIERANGKIIMFRNI